MLCVICCKLWNLKWINFYFYIIWCERGFKYKMGKKFVVIGIVGGFGSGKIIVIKVIYEYFKGYFIMFFE